MRDESTLEGDYLWGRRLETAPSETCTPTMGLFRAGETSLPVVCADEDGDALSELKVLSGSSDLFLDTGFFREGTLSGQVH